MVWPFQNKKVAQDSNGESSGKLLESRQTTESTLQNEEEEEDGYKNKFKYAPKRQNEDIAMDLGTLTDIFSFGFMKGRPILNFFLAILWSIGLPILIYNILKPYIGQVLAMIVASVPPLGIVIVRMLKDRTFDPLGCVAGISFLISGILSIAEPDEKTAAICESIVPLLVGVMCIISVIPIKIGSFELKPLVFQMANQIMPRSENEDLQKQDDLRLTSKSPPSGQKRLDYLYHNMAKFRHDMRFMTVSWGVVLITSFVVKVIIVTTSTDIGKAQIIGYVILGLASVTIIVFTWIYTNIVKGHVLTQVAFWKEEEDKKMDKGVETAENISWGVNSMNNVFAQVAG
ncbi:hypothetical protein INT47_006208 [Mucor saturninus]|uniref:Uncharacterized protein n=1 Tax=Mucor saturninus TaxID=64648 RepID=A0A8H7UNH1_9FUNG|nr:hypothetical protein INT47_006208 [Mucor saturninus]